MTQKGFTLLEVLVSFMLIGLMSGLVFANYAIVLRTQALTARRIQAQGVAERTIIAAQARPCEWVNEPTDQPRHDTLRDEGILFAREVDVMPLRGIDLWRFHVIITWAQFGRPQRVELLTHQTLGTICSQWVVPYGRP